EYVWYDEAGYVVCGWAQAPHRLWESIHQFALFLAKAENAVLMNEPPAWLIEYPEEARRVQEELWASWAAERRTRLYADFAARFACEGLHGPAQPCNPLELDRAEAALETYLPASYRQFLFAHGPLFVPRLWDLVVERDLDAHPLREFLSPDQVVNDTQLYWS